MLRVSLLGTFGIALDANPIRLNFGPSGQRMAACLFAFSGRPHLRERLADMFWPEMNCDRSRAALNSALWRLRKILAAEPKSDGGRNLRTVGSHVVLEPASWLDVDSHKIDALCHAPNGSVSAGGDVTFRRELQAMIDRYRGPLLEDEEAQIFTEERERIHANFVKIAQTLIGAYVANCAYESAINVCRRVHFLDPYRELIVRCLLVLLVLNEQRAEAVRLYESWKKSLRSDLGVEPMPRTAELILTIRSLSNVQQIDGLRNSVSAELSAA
ncbi:MAG: BTAD domain-containing putative transcriptional regulator [Reyranella sp.]|nr:BTAD domain-containing putative transcriptional regulator [Reyranella sp.]MDP3158657.1 BTAD domain-containing putative transcriptional regulator [Reyranella sp.]